MTAAADDNSSQDWVADYDGEGRERVARDGGDRGVVMMSAAKMAVAEDSGCGRQRQQRRMTAVDHNGTQDRAAAYNREGREWAANNDGIRHRTEKMMLFLVKVTQCFVVSRYNNMLFLAGFVQFFVCGGFVNKKESCLCVLLTT